MVDRAPDKMIDFLHGHVLLAYRNTIIYIDVNHFGIDKPELTIPSEYSKSDRNFIQVDITQDQVLELELHSKYKIICIQEIGCN